MMQAKQILHIYKPAFANSTLCQKHQDIYYKQVLNNCGKIPVAGGTVLIHVIKKSVKGMLLKVIEVLIELRFQYVAYEETCLPAGF